jgi:monoamine oxidase
LTEDVEGVPLELGAQWIGDTHHRMEALAPELGVGIYPQFEDGETSYEFAGEVLRERAFYAKYADELSGVERVLRKLDQMAETVPADAPWLAPEADAWDRLTAGQW